MSTKPETREVKEGLPQKQEAPMEEVWEKLPSVLQRQLTLQLAKLLEGVMVQATSGEVRDE